jgi:large subunit ribosomal protein L6
MSRVGKKIRVIPAGVQVEVKQNRLIVKGPKGELTQLIHPHVTISVNDGKIEVTVADPENKKDRALWGTFSSIIANLLEGVTKGFKKELEISGVGYKASMSGANLVLDVGYSHPVNFAPTSGVKLSVEKNVITVEGFDKQIVGEIAAQIRAIKKAEPYKGKGIKYIDEIVRRKAGKTATKAAA